MCSLFSNDIKVIGLLFLTHIIIKFIKPKGCAIDRVICEGVLVKHYE